ncbi:hypothetical protein B7C42_01647 [Nocardia cerradoensis]|uniref:Tail terminator n=1 Tax=Nocardia cerradoensis TaxID=85688 RepID=A0A231HCZ2_9NOCA|nr:hypothetical protein [Nocardia cerradoensis]OXR46672.1 hypothetical protein B7C42_01647 [Nocardia cerradoensis]
MRPEGRHFANLRTLLRTYLLTLDGIGGAGTKLEMLFPFVLITVIPSGGDNYLWSRQTVDIEVFHSDYAAGADFTRHVHDHMMRLRHTYVDGVPISDVVNINNFGDLDYQDDTVHRWIAEYEIESSVDSATL